MGMMQLAVPVSQRREPHLPVQLTPKRYLSHRFQFPAQMDFQNTRDMVFFFQNSPCFILGIASGHFTRGTGGQECPKSNLSGCLMKRSVKSY